MADARLAVGSARSRHIEILEYGSVRVRQGSLKKVEQTQCRRSRQFGQIEGDYSTAPLAIEGTSVNQG